MGYVNVGMLGNLTREIPIAYGKGDRGEVDFVYSVVFTYYLVTTLLSLILISILYLAGFTYKGSLTSTIILFILLIKLSSFFDSFFHAYVKGEGKFKIYGKYEYVVRVGGPILNVLLVYVFGIYGIFIGMTLTHALGAFFVWSQLGKPSVSIRFNFEKTRELLSTGLPMFMNQVADSIFISVGILIASMSLSNSEVGILSYALIIASTSKIPFANILSMTVRREMGVEAGRYGVQNRTLFRKYFRKPLAVYSLFTTLLIGALVIFYSIAVDVFLIQFKRSIPLMVVMFPSIVLYNLRNYIYAYLNVTKQMNSRSVILVIAIALNAILAHVYLELGYGIDGIVYSILLAFVFIALVAATMAFDQIFGHLQEKVLLLSKYITVAIVLGICLYVVVDVDLFKYTHEINKYLAALINLAAQLSSFIVITICVYVVLFKDQRLYDEIKLLLRYVSGKFGFSVSN